MTNTTDLLRAAAQHLGDLTVAYAGSLAATDADLSRRVIDGTTAVVNALTAAQPAETGVLLSQLHNLMLGAQQRALTDDRPLPALAERVFMLERLAEAYDAGADDGPSPKDAWAL